MKNKIEKSFYIGLLLICGLMFSNMSFSQERNGFQELEASLFLDQIMEENNHILIDVRTAEDYQKGRIQGAVNAPESTVMNALLDTIDCDRPVLIYCYYGKRSRMAAEKMLEKYDVKIYCLAGGLIAWKDQGYKLDTKRIRKKK